MKKIIITLILGAAVYSSKAQTTNKAVTENDPKVNATDSIINAQIIRPARKAASGQAPDWAALTQTITQKYDATTADRTITKAKIYFYYNKDWPQFCSGIVHYTDNYELAGDYPKLNLNAGMMLQYSQSQAELKEALKWAKAATDSDPNNEQYQQTYNSLKAKINP